MADPKDEPLDLDTMSDEDFMKLDPTEMEEVPDTVEEEEIIDETPDPDEETPDDVPNEDGTVPDGDTPDEPGADPDPETPGEEADTPGSEDGKEGIDPNAEPDPDKVPDDAKPKDPPKKKEKEPVKPDAKEKKPVEEVKPSESETADAVDFYAKVTASFKADGKEMKIRSPEDAIRLMQMGVNYSRRMEEMKPLRAQDQMLKANGLNSPDKINFMIDLLKGKPEAIKQLLIDHKIDPVDIDTTDVTPYKATNYEGDPKDIAFDDAIQTTIAAEGGRALIQDINKEWDDQSKEALRDQPAIFQNVLAQKQSGVYLKIKTELEYQRTMGFLTDVPFLQAYHQVGEAMQNAGVFKTEDKAQPTPAAKVAIGTGTRKAALKPTIEKPNPNISSATPPRSAPSKDGGQKEQDYSSMSDEDFMKMAPPG